MHSIPPLPAGELDASHVTARLSVTGHSLTLCAQQQAHDKGSVRSWGSPPGGRALYLRRLRTLFGTAYTQLENRRRECRTIDTQSIMAVPRYLLSKGTGVACVLSHWYYLHIGRTFKVTDRTALLVHRNHFSPLSRTTRFSQTTTNIN